VVGVTYPPEWSEVLDWWAALARSCFWWWPYEGVVFVSARPTLLGIDESGRLHSEVGAAMEFSDGYALHYWHGTAVPREWLEKKDSIDPKLALTWDNAEQRRCLAEIIGWGRVIEQLSPVVVDKHRDPMIGTLLRVDLPDSPGEQFLKVRCATGLDFVLPVPPEMKTARQAGAWTYGLTEKQYRLEGRA